MALTLGTVNNDGADYVKTTTLTCDSSYQTGGYSILPNQVGMNLRIDDIVPIAQSASYIAIWNTSTQKLQIMQDTGSGLVEVPASTNLATLNVQCMILGV